MYRLKSERISSLERIVRKAMELLEDVSIAEHTQWSIVYNQSTGRDLVCMDMKYDKVYDF